MFFYYVAVNGQFRDATKYVNGVAPTDQDVVFITDFTKKGVVIVNVPAHKENKAADIIIRDGLMIIEDGAGFTGTFF